MTSGGLARSFRSQQVGRLDDGIAASVVQRTAPIHMAAIETRRRFVARLLDSWLLSGTTPDGFFGRPALAKESIIGEMLSREAPDAAGSSLIGR